jgi:hypothetical protein
MTDLDFYRMQKRQNISGVPTPFRNYTQFDAETLKVMAAAYDAVAARLKLQPNDPRTGRLAAKIITLASEGERNVGKLTEKASTNL